MESIKNFFVTFFYGIYLIVSYVYRSVAYIIKKILEALGFVWYPIKERLSDCCNRERRRQNPYKNPNYNTFV
jgi:hypothetical protein